MVKYFKQGTKKPPSRRSVKQKHTLTFRKKLDAPTLKKLAIAFAIVLLAASLYVNYLAPHTLEARQRVELERTQKQLIESKRSLQDQKGLDAAKQKQLEEIQQKLKETEAALQAKRSVPAPTVALAAPAPAPAQPRPVSGTCAQWIAQAGIVDVVNAQEVIRRESGCNPNAINPSSGACGVAQELPCGKSGCSLGDGACQVRWMNSYVLGRYGSWAGAVAFHNANHWY